MVRVFGTMSLFLPVIGCGLDATLLWKIHGEIESRHEPLLDSATALRHHLNTQQVEGASSEDIAPSRRSSQYGKAIDLR
jgi:hypothetical protein